MGSHLNFKGFASTTPIEANATRPQEIPPLAHQPSVYSLTFDEFHNTWGSGLFKDVGSMNMDELLKNIWSVEETQAMTNSVAVAEGSTPSGNLQRQGSLALPRTLSQKTVDEVWRDLIKETTVGIKDGTGGVGSNFPQRQPTLGEMTLEDFLVRAGAVRADTPQTGMATNGFLDELSQMNNNSSNGLALGFQQPNQNKVFFGSRMMENNNSLAASQPPNLGLNVGGVRSVQKLPQQQQQLHHPQPQQQQQLHHPQPQQQQQLHHPQPQQQQQLHHPQPQQPQQLHHPQPQQLHHPQPQQLHRPQPQAQQHLLFPKPATAAYAAPMNLVNSGQLASQGMRSSIVGIADQSTNNSSVHGGGMGMVGSGTGGIRAATTTPANPISPDVISNSNTSSPSLSPVPYVFTRGRKPSAALEMVVERRQRRMIKNRESAARSRARKQAYTLELEAEIVKLKEVNDELQKKQKEIGNMQKNEFLEAMKGKWGGKRLCLRRTLTGPW